jgi:hypothetical protein
MPVRIATTIGGVTFEAFPVDHSTRAPAVSYRVTLGSRCIFYVPDVVAIHNRHEALQGADLYIGDGATIAARRGTDRTCSDHHSTRLVRKGRRTAGGIHPLRLGNRQRR